MHLGGHFGHWWYPLVPIGQLLLHFWCHFWEHVLRLLGTLRARRIEHVFFRITWASFLFFNIELMLNMQLLGKPPNSNRCTGGAPNRASSLQVLPCAVSFSQHFRRVAFGDPLRSFWSSFVIISMVLNTVLDKCCPLPPVVYCLQICHLFWERQGHALCPI